MIGITVRGGVPAPGPMVADPHLSYADPHLSYADPDPGLRNS